MNIRSILPIIALISCGAGPSSKNGGFLSIDFDDDTLSIEKSPVDSKYNVPKIKIDKDISAAVLKSFSNSIDSVSKSKPSAIILEINSLGGSIMDGFKMVKIIEESKIPIHCIVDGQADSMAFYILQSCSTRTSTYRSTLMWHLVRQSLMNVNDSQEYYRERADDIDVSSQAMTEFIADRLNADPKRILDRIRVRAWFMPAREALEVHAIDMLTRNVKDYTASLRNCDPLKPLNCEKKAEPVNSCLLEKH